MIQVQNLLTLLMSVAFLAACSGDRDTESQKDALEKMSDKAAEKAVQHIQAPIDKALQVQQIENERIKAIEKAVTD